MQKFKWFYLISTSGSHNAFKIARFNAVRSDWGSVVFKWRWWISFKGGFQVGFYNWDEIHFEGKLTISAGKEFTESVAGKYPFFFWSALCLQFMWDVLFWIKPLDAILNDEPRVMPFNDKIGIQSYCKILITNFWNVFDVNPYWNCYWLYRGQLKLDNIAIFLQAQTKFIKWKLFTLCVFEFCKKIG